MIHSSRKIEIIIFIASLSILIFVLGLQFISKIQPCELCHLQRWPYLLTTTFALISFVISKDQKIYYNTLLILIFLTFLFSLTFATYHLGIEQKLWVGFSNCSQDYLSSGKSLNELKKQLLQTPIIRCDEILWSVGGVSLAGLNVLASAILTLVSFKKIYIIVFRKTKKLEH